jgi:hypothetical protein
LEQIETPVSPGFLLGPFLFFLVVFILVVKIVTPKKNMYVFSVFSFGF